MSRKAHACSLKSREMGSLINQAVILAGGMGERLRPITNHIPKPMAPVNGKPFLDYLIESIRAVGIQRILLLLGYRHEVVTQHYKDDPNISFSIGAVEDLTCKRVLNAIPLLDERFMLTYGDNYWPIEFESMLKLYRRLDPVAMTCVFDNKKGESEYGFENNVYLDDQNRVAIYDRTRKDLRLNGVDIGYFLMRRSTFEAIPNTGNPSLDTDLIPQLVSKGEMMGFSTQKRYYYITSPSSLAEFEKVVTAEGIRALGDS